MRARAICGILLLSAITSIVSYSQSSEHQELDPIRIERLAGLAKVWGAVKYFHPYLAYREIDWDNALIDTIPKVKAAKTPQEYTEAINLLLAVLNDTTTHARFITQGTVDKIQPQRTDTKAPIRIEENVLMIDAYGVEKAIDRSNKLFPEVLAKTMPLVPQARATIIDLRLAEPMGEISRYYLDRYLRNFLSVMLDRNVPLASLRYRLHNGYTPQSDDVGNVFSSALVNTTPNTIVGTNKLKAMPLLFLVNEHSPAIDIVSGMQAAQRAFVLQDRETTKELGAVTTTIKLPENVEVEMRTADFINPDGTVGFTADSLVARDEAMSTVRRVIAENKFASQRKKTESAFVMQVSQRDKTYPEMEYPTSEYRLLALFRFWNIIHYFYPYKGLLDVSWDTVLPRYIPKFEANQDAADYQITVLELAAEVQDSHVNVRNYSKVGDKFGRFYPPFILKFIDGQSVITEVFEKEAAVKPGDAILSVDGVPTEKYRQSLPRIFAASTPQALQPVLHLLAFLRGPKDSQAKLIVRGLDGITREIVVTRNIGGGDERRVKARFRTPRTTPVFQVLPSGFGYVDLDRLTLAEVDKMFEAIKNTPAVIFDMRGYPNGTAWEIAPRLRTKKPAPDALLSRPLVDATNFNSTEEVSLGYTFIDKLAEPKGEIYKGKVVMLINEEAISQAEGTCQMFEAATDVTFIGTPTMGADGDISMMVMPGNLPITFTGLEVRFADGRPQQRVGIQPHIRVTPTIRGTLEGRDEILAAAIKFLQESKSKQ